MGVLIGFGGYLGIQRGSRKAALWSQAVGIRWADEAGVPQESQDDEEGGAEAGVHELQNQVATGAETM